MKNKSIEKSIYFPPPPLGFLCLIALSQSPIKPTDIKQFLKLIITSPVSYITFVTTIFIATNFATKISQLGFPSFCAYLQPFKPCDSLFYQPPVNCPLKYLNRLIGV